MRAKKLGLFSLTLELCLTNYRCSEWVEEIGHRSALIRSTSPCTGMVPLTAKYYYPRG